MYNEFDRHSIEHNALTRNVNTRVVAIEHIRKINATYTKCERDDCMCEFAREIIETRICAICEQFNIDENDMIDIIDNDAHI